MNDPLNELSKAKPNEDELRDMLKSWCDDTNHYKLSQRIAFVPYNILKVIAFRPVQEAEIILTKAGY
jgi:hypothetical protein